MLCSQTSDAAGNVFISAGQAISKVTPQGSISSVVDGLDGGFYSRHAAPTAPPSATTDFGGPPALTVDTKGNLYTAYPGKNGSSALRLPGKAAHRPLRNVELNIKGLCDIENPVQRSEYTPDRPLEIPICDRVRLVQGS
jgi:hypothetical protein